MTKSTALLRGSKWPSFDVLEYFGLRLCREAYRDACIGCQKFLSRARARVLFQLCSTKGPEATHAVSSLRLSVRLRCEPFQSIPPCFANIP